MVIFLTLINIFFESKIFIIYSFIFQIIRSSILIKSLFRYIVFYLVYQLFNSLYLSYLLQDQ
jgi:hypothetical protein